VYLSPDLSCGAEVVTVVAVGSCALGFGVSVVRFVPAVLQLDSRSCLQCLGPSG
jgi:hypothetical protein